MKVYFIRDNRYHRAEILNILKQTLRENALESEVDPVFSLAYDRGNQFFLKTANEILWGNVFFEPFSYQDARALHQEMDRITKLFNQKISPYVFAVEFVSGGGLLEILPVKPHCFKFHFLDSVDGQALALDEWVPDPQGVSQRQADGPARIPDLKGYQFFKQSQLTREELAELIELSLELKNQSSPDK